MISKEVKKLQTKVLNRYIKLSTKYPILVDTWCDSITDIVFNTNRSYRFLSEEMFVINNTLDKSNFLGSYEGSIEPYSEKEFSNDSTWFSEFEGNIDSLIHVFINLGIDDKDNVIKTCKELYETKQYENVLMALVMLNTLKFKR